MEIILVFLRLIFVGLYQAVQGQVHFSTGKKLLGYLVYNLTEVVLLFTFVCFVVLR